MLDARRLITLEAVARTGAFAAAAEELGYTQSAISQHIAELERVAGLRLLDRRPVRLTDAGRVALRAAHAAAEAITAAETELRALRDGHAGKVRLGAFSSGASALAAPAIAAFAGEYPAVEVTLVQIETPDAYEALIDGRLDLALTFDYDLEAHHAPAAIERTPLAADPVLVALPESHPLAARSAIELTALADEAWIAAPMAGLPLGALRGAGGAGFEPRLRFVGDDFRTVLALVANGLGIALLPALAIQRPPDGVALRDLADPPLTRRLSTARLRMESPRPRVAALEHAIRGQPG